MNAAQRKTIGKINTKLEELKGKIEAQFQQLAGFIEDLDDLYNEIDQERQDEDDKYENLPEGFQNGDMGQAMQEAIDKLQAAQDAVEEFKSMFEDLNTDKLEEACSSLSEV